MLDQINVARGQVIFDHRIVRPMCHAIWVCPHCAPEVGDPVVEIVHRLNPWLAWSAKKDGKRSCKRLDVVFNIAKA
jgi:hypothetical protein